MKKYLIVFLLLMPSYSQASNWYVSTTSKGSNNGTSWGNCWGGLNNVVWGTNGVNAGDTLYIDGGISGVKYNTSLSVGANGTADNNRITVKPGQDTGHNGLVTIDLGGSSYGGINLDRKEYITIDGMQSGQGGSRGIKLTNNSMAAGAHDIVSANGSKFCNVKYIEVKFARDGITGTSATKLDISYCKISEIKGDHAIKVIGKPVAPYNSQYGGQSHIHHNEITIDMGPAGTGYGPDGIQATGWTEIDHNLFLIGVKNKTDIVDKQHSDMIQLASGMWWTKIHANTWIGCPQYCLYLEASAFGDSIANLQVYNNLFDFRGGDASGGIVFGFSTGSTIDNMIISNNTLVDTGGSGGTTGLCQGFQMDFTGNLPTTTNTYIQNNLLYNMGPAKAGRAMWIRGTNVTENFVRNNLNVDYNIVNAGSHGSNNILYGPNGSVSGFTQTHPRTGTPSFVSYTPYNPSGTNNYQLSPSDIAAKDQGTPLSSYFTTDILGNTRPRGSAWDIGAYETIESPPLPVNRVIIK